LYPRICPLVLFMYVQNKEEDLLDPREVIYWGLGVE
jgi:hypothetical protein